MEPMDELPPDNVLREMAEDTLAWQAKQRGDMRKMPLTGKAALEAIRQG